MESNLIRIADALERIASALERFWPVYVTPTPFPNYTPPYIVPAFPFTSPTTQPYVPNYGPPTVPNTGRLLTNVCDAGAGVSEPYPTRCVDPACGELHNANAYPTRPAPVDLSGESDLANYRARGSSGDPA